MAKVIQMSIENEQRVFIAAHQNLFREMAAEARAQCPNMKQMGLIVYDFDDRLVLSYWFEKPIAEGMTSSAINKNIFLL